ncbi:MAG: iron-sulfur cluster assembly protein [Nitrososphaerales archaeon]
MEEKITEEQVYEAIEEVVDPELGLSVLELNLIDEVQIKEDGIVEITYHATAPFCPPIFAIEMSQDIKRRVEGLKGVKRAKVTLKGHALADEINKEVNRE